MLDGIRHTHRLPECDVVYCLGRQVYLCKSNAIGNDDGDCVGRYFLSNRRISLLLRRDGAGELTCPDYRNLKRRRD